MINPKFVFNANHVSSPQEYGRFQQHLGLLGDAVRLGSYYSAIIETPPGKFVIDVGAGTGILALLALKHGYEHAVLVEPSSKMCHYAAYLLDKNGLSGRYDIINSSFEEIPPGTLPDPVDVDLVVTETISSLVLGFGCWNALADYTNQLSKSARTIPAKASVRAAYARAGYGGSSGGMRLLRDLGIDVDLENYTFHSGGNVIDKARFNFDILRNELIFKELASITLGTNSSTIDLVTQSIRMPWSGTVSGIVSYFSVELSTRNPRNILNSADPSLLSWAPLYVPTKSPIHVTAGDQLALGVSLCDGDAPFPYAFEFHNEYERVTERLFW